MNYSKDIIIARAEDRIRTSSYEGGAEPLFKSVARFVKRSAFTAVSLGNIGTHKVAHNLRSLKQEASLLSFSLAENARALLVATNPFGTLQPAYAGIGRFVPPRPIVFQKQRPPIHQQWTAAVVAACVCAFSLIPAQSTNQDALSHPAAPSKAAMQVKIVVPAQKPTVQATKRTMLPVHVVLPSHAVTASVNPVNSALPHFNAAKAAAFTEKLGAHPTGWCGSGVRQILNAAGLSIPGDTKTHHLSRAASYKDVLPKMGFIKVGSGGNGWSFSVNQARKDVQSKRGYINCPFFVLMSDKNHPRAAGHIFYVASNGSTYSDFKQGRGTGYTHYDIFAYTGQADGYVVSQPKDAPVYASTHHAYRHSYRTATNWHRHHASVMNAG